MRRLKVRGFTLLELLVVISLIGLLVSIGAVSYTSAQKKSRDSRRKGDLKAIQNGFEQYYSENDASYPKTAAEAATAIVGGLPVDPKNSGTYVYTIQYDDVDGTAYCACGLLESDAGNATAVPVSTACSYGTGDYFCASNLQ